MFYFVVLLCFSGEGHTPTSWPHEKRRAEQEKKARDNDDAPTSWPHEKSRAEREKEGISEL